MPRGGSSLQRARVGLGCALVAAVALVPAACGGGSSKSGSTATSAVATNGQAARTPKQILASARAAANAARSVHIAGHVPTPGQTVSLDLALLRGRGATGLIALNGIPVGVTQVGHALYLKAGRRFLKAVGAPEAAVQLLAGRWFKAPTQGPQAASLRSFRQLTDMQTILNEVLTPSARVSKAGTGTVGGTPTVVLRDSDGTLDVSLQGPPYPLRVRQRQGNGQVTFSRWDAPVTLAAPAGAVDLSGSG